MNGLTFLEALGDIDEKDLVRAEAYFKESKAKTITGTVFKIIGTAASVVLIVWFALFMWYVSVRMKDPVKPSDSTSEPVVTNTETAEETEEPETGEAEPSRGLRYEKQTDGTYSVSGIGSCTDEDIVIPELYEGAAVVGISASAFEGRSIKSVIIPATVGNIMKNAFKDCTVLETVTVRPASPERSGDGLKTVGDSAFQGCSSLKEIVLPDTVTDIEREAFANCTAMQRIRLPAGLDYSPGTSIFEGCTALEYAEFPQGVRCVPSRIFFGCTALQTVLLPESLTKIEFEAFMNCTSLHVINIPDNVSSIGSDAFNGCASLKKIVIPDKVTDLGNGVFSGCTSLYEVNSAVG